MDETTHGISDNVLDRAFVLEFWDVDLAAYPRWGTRSIPAASEARAREVLAALMQALSPARLHFGWRIVDDVLKMSSISKERVPDLVLVVESAERTRFVVLDAKYRSSRLNVLDAMASAHIYQDSLRMGSKRPDASILLVPSGGGASWLEDPAFQAEHRVGLHVLSPGIDNALPELLKAALRV